MGETVEPLKCGFCGEPLLSDPVGYCRRSEEHARAQLASVKAELAAVKRDIEVYRPLCIMGDFAIQELYDNGQLPDRTEIKIRMVTVEAERESRKRTREYVARQEDDIYQLEHELQHARAEIARLRDALAPFAKIAEEFELSDELNSVWVDKARAKSEISGLTIRHFVNALAALNPPEEPQS